MNELLYTDKQLRLMAEQAAAEFIESEGVSMSSACEKRLRKVRDDYERRIRIMELTNRIGESNEPATEGEPFRAD